MRRPIDDLTFEDLNGLEDDVKEIIDKVCAAIEGKPIAAAFSAVTVMQYAVERNFEYARSCGDIFVPVGREDIYSVARDVAADVAADIVAAKDGTQS